MIREERREVIEFIKRHKEIDENLYQRLYLYQSVPLDSASKEALIERLNHWDTTLKVLEQEPRTLNDARENFMSDVYNTLDFLPTNDEANHIIDSFDRITSEIVEQEPCEDAISLEVVIEWLKVKDIIKTSSQEECARKELKALLPVTSQSSSRWNLISEKLPSKDGTYKVVEKSGRIGEYVFHSNGNSEEYWKRCAVAWMPLQESED